MASRKPNIDPRVEIGHVHLTVSDLSRSVAFYEDVLGFPSAQRVGQSTAFLSADGAHHHIALHARDGGGEPAAPQGGGDAYHFALRYPSRAALAAALRRLKEAGVSLEGARDHGVSEALYVRDPDGNRLELYWDKAAEGRTPEGEGSALQGGAPLDVEALRQAAEEAPTEGASLSASGEQRQLLTPGMRDRLRELRSSLLSLHKVLLDDAKSAYEMDRGRVGSNASLLQLVINDPWFAWLHPLSELVVRIDETLQPDAPASESDGATLLDHVARLLSPEHGPDEFGRRYYEALQRQPAVIVAHAEVRRILKRPR